MQRADLAMGWGKRHGCRTFIRKAVLEMPKGADGQDTGTGYAGQMAFGGSIVGCRQPDVKFSGERSRILPYKGWGDTGYDAK